MTMPRTARLLLALWLCVSSVLLPLPISGAGSEAVGLSQSAPDPSVQITPKSTPAQFPALHLKAGLFNPAAGQSMSVAAPLSVPEESAEFWIVQFEGPILSEWRAALEAEGVEVVAYLPDFAYKVRMDQAQARESQRCPMSSMLGLFSRRLSCRPM